MSSIKQLFVLAFVVAISVVFVLTTSKSEEEKLAAYDLKIAGYILKKDIAEGFMSVVTMLDHFWRVVELP